MATRKDMKGRILRRGESQRKDGRYCFKYVDARGKTRSVYSWTLTTHDFTPKRKRSGPCLRELEQRIQRDLFDNVAPENMTVLELATKYTETKTAVRPTTRTGYKTVLNFLADNEFGSRRISDITTLDAKEWLISLQRDCGKRYSSIHTIRGVLRPAFQLAEEDDLIRRNPFNFELATILVNDQVAREALTPKQERRFLDFVRSDSHYSRYHDAFYILLNTGLRISEFCGLTAEDIDFERGSVCVSKQLQRSSDMRYYIERPKTSSGVRYVPMSEGVAECFRRVVANRPKPPIEPVVDGVSGFLFLDKNQMPRVALHWEKYFQYAVAKHNRIYKDELPKITPHVCRHTFCSKMARKGMDPVKLKYVMGHSDIDVTYNTYTHLGFDDVKADVLRFEEEAAWAGGSKS